MPRLRDIAHRLFSVSFYATVTSWIALLVFLASSRFDVPVLGNIAMFVSVIAVVSAITCEELALRGVHQGRKIWGVLVIIAAIVCAIIAIYGFAISDSTLCGSAVLSLFVVSFVPGILDFFGVGQRRVYVEHRNYTDEYGYPSDPWSIFGMGTPKTPPPIIIEQGDDLDDEWREYLGVEMPQHEDKLDEVENSFEENAVETEDTVNDD